jgi:dTDP-4-amino-4,6-dideoxygalactose transaminase
MLINKEASGSNNNKKIVYLTKSCRDAIKQILVSGSENKRILIPAYIGLSLEEGSGILDPVKESDTIFEFYNVDRHLDPDLDSLEMMLSSFVPTHILLVNYFGFLTGNRFEVFELLSKHPISVIEDFAHLIEPLNSNRCFPQLADYEVVSLHKTIGSGVGGGALLCKSSIPAFSDTISLDSLRIYSKSDLDYISNVRWRNYRYIQESLDSLECDSIQPFFADHRTPITPLNFPIRLKNLDMRHELYKKLIAVGIIPTALYHRLVGELSSERFPKSVDISQRILNLPTHQDVGLPELNVLVETMRKFCNEY